MPFDDDLVGGVFTRTQTLRRTHLLPATLPDPCHLGSHLTHASGSVRVASSSPASLRVRGTWHLQGSFCSASQVEYIRSKIHQTISKTAMNAAATQRNAVNSLPGVGGDPLKRPPPARPGVHAPTRPARRAPERDCGRGRPG